MSGPRAYPIFSISVKLLAAILVLVMAFAFGVQVLLQGVVESSYRSTFDEQFRRQIDAVVQRQQARANSAHNEIVSATTSVRLIAAAYAGNADRFYADLAFELTDVMDAAASSGGSPFIRFVDAAGRMLHSAEPGAGRLPGMSEPELAATLEPLARAGAVDRRVESGFLLLGDGPTESLYTVTAVPLEDPATATILGEIFLVRPVLDVGEVLGRSGPGARAGLIVGGRLHSTEIPTHLHELVRRDLSQDDPVLRLEGAQHVGIVRLLSPGGRFAEAEYASLFSMSGLEGVLDELRARALAFMGVALTIVVLASVVVAERFTRPIRELVSGTDRIQNGDFDIVLPVRSRDELGELTHSFNAMAADLAVKEKYRSVLEKVTDPDVADRLIRGDVALGGSSVDATVLFCDIRGFTPFTRSNPAQSVVSLLNAHMTAMTGIVNRFNGVVDKFAGDEIMAIFGLLQSRPDDALNAARCAQAMVKAREELNATGSHPWEVGIGIATGPMVAGCMGSEERLHFTVVGERVNLAARLCGAAGSGQVLLDDASVRACGDALVTRVSEGLQLKGIDGGTTAYELVNASV